MTSVQNYYDFGGTLRACNPQETLERVHPLLTTMGITRIADVTGLDTIGIPVATCIRPNSKHLAVSQGKGITQDLARVSAVMESIESYHAENPRQPDLFGNYESLSEQYRLLEPKLLNNGFFENPQINLFDMNWIAAYDVLSECETYIPYALINIDSTKIQQEYAYFNVTSNGLASGNTYEEALCHALYEIVERDALARWGRKKVAERMQALLDLNSVDNSMNREMIARVQQQGFHLDIWDVSSNTGIAAFQAMIVSPDPIRNLGRFVGSGAHLRRDIALSRAITEAAQSRLTLISGSRDDVFPEYYLEKQEDSITMHDIQASHSYHECPNEDNMNTFTDALNKIYTELKNLGCTSVYVVDHTKVEFNIPVVHAICPELLGKA